MKRLLKEDLLIITQKGFIRSGWVKKEANMRKVLQRRFLALSANHLIYFHEKPTDGAAVFGISRRDIPLVDIISISADFSSNIIFQVKLPDRDFIFKTATAVECNDWVTAIKMHKEEIENEIKVKTGIKIILQPNVFGCVLKTKSVSDPSKKIFVNVFWSDEIETFISMNSIGMIAQPTSLTAAISVFSIILPGHLAVNCNSTAVVKDEVYRRILSHIDVDIDPEKYSLPKIRQGYVQ